ncbi:MAG: pyridoxal phosphate-dependent aminotransferase [Gemmatimonadota bacterium]
MRLSPNLDGVSGSETLRISELAAELRARGVPVVSLSAGEPDFDTPAHVRAAGTAAIERGHTRYTATAGIAALRSAIARDLARRTGVDYDASDVLVGSGAKQVLYNACMALFGPGDEVLVPAPFWVSYPAMIRLARATPVVVDCGSDAGYKVTVDCLSVAVTRRTRGLILNSPSNPTGAVYSAGELADLTAFCAERELWILSDEIYARLCYAPGVAPSTAAAGPHARERTVTVNGFSKAFAMTGWRIGYGAAPREVTAAMEVVQSHSSSNASSIGQYAALAALEREEESDAAVEDMRRAFERRRDRLLAGLEGLPGVRNLVPHGVFYVFTDVREHLASRDGGSSEDFCAALLRDHALALVPGSAFGMEGHVRWSFAASEAELDEGIARFRAAVLGAGG